MLTRLKVNGFKNLVDIDVRFGPFTCIAGANGFGKPGDTIRITGRSMPLMVLCHQNSSEFARKNIGSFHSLKSWIGNNEVYDEN